MNGLRAPPLPVLTTRSTQDFYETNTLVNSIVAEGGQFLTVSPDHS